MGLQASFLIAWRSLSRRKSKNLSAILAVTLGVTLLVGIQITTATLDNAFLSSLSQSQGEVDVQISNSTMGGYLKIEDQALISDLAPEAAGIMPELTSQIPALVESQFDPKMSAAGIPTNYSAVFGDFYDWKTGNKLDLNSLLDSNTSILLSSNQAEKLGIAKDTSLPVKFQGIVMVLNSECPRLNLSDYSYVNVTATGSPNAAVILGFVLDDGSTM